MQTIVAIAVVALVASSYALPRVPLDKSTPRLIVGGVEAALGSVPHQVSFELLGTHFCGGSILDAKNVLTAAHCCAYFPIPQFLSISAGLNNIKNPEAGAQLHVRLDGIKIHPNYNSSSFSNDVCVLNLASPLNLGPSFRTAAIPLPTAGYLATGDAIISGWGATQYSGQGSDALLTATVPIIPDSTCRDIYGANAIRDSMICAGGSEGGKDSCQGDSGGPLVDSNGQVVGIVSWGIGCGSPGIPGVYTEVSTFIEFINDSRI